MRPPIHPDLRNALALLGEIPDHSVTAQDCWKAVAPKCPPGKTYPRWSFWGRIQYPVIIRAGRVFGIVNHIHAQKKHAEKTRKPWPPKPIFVPIPSVPMPTQRK